MEKELKCMRCGSTKNVFMDSIFDRETNEIELFPMCINCVKKALNFKNKEKWETDLKNLELDISGQLIDDKFPELKFKKSAQLALIRLMEKYSIQIVFETCFGINEKDFNLNTIKNKCKQKAVS